MKTGQPCGRWREAIHLRVCGALEGREAARVEAHLARCAECRRYGEELQEAISGLRWLGSRDVEPRPGFRARWTRAVEESTRPSSFGEAAGALVAWGRGLLLRNLRPALGIGSLWILALVFRLSAPAAAPSTQATAAHSPLEIARALEADQSPKVWPHWKRDPLPAPPRQPHTRRERFPAQPTGQLEHEQEMHTTTTAMFAALIAQRDSPALTLI
jgi:anti-sigma factor RsiW